MHDDDTVLALTAPIFDAVYEYLRREVLTPRMDVLLVLQVGLVPA